MYSFLVHLKDRAGPFGGGWVLYRKVSIIIRSQGKVIEARLKKCVAIAILSVLSPLKL